MAQSIFLLKQNNVRDEMDKGRGVGPVFSHPIELEPLFKPFTHNIEAPQGFFRRLFSNPIAQPQHQEILPLENLGFISIRPPAEESFYFSQFEKFLVSLKLPYPVSFEIIGNKDNIVFQLSAKQDDLPLITNILQTHFSEVEAVENSDFLAETMKNTQPVMASYYLKDSHFFPLKDNSKIDPYVVLLSNFNSIAQGMAALQIIFTPVKNSWAENMHTACREEDDSTQSFFSDLKELPKLVSNKINKPLLAVSIRIIASEQRLLERAESFLNQYNNEDNGFIRIENYPISSALKRTVHTPGIILNSEELSQLIHLPAPEINVPKLARATKSNKPPQMAQAGNGIILGQNTYQGRVSPVCLTQEWFTRHMAIFGGTGAGKTNLLGYMFQQLSQQDGCAFIDPNGDAAEEFLSLIPASSLDRVIYFNPLENPLSINPMEVNGQNTEVIAVNLLVALKRLFDASAWGPRMEWILRKTIITLLASGDKTLADITKILTDDTFRKTALANIKDTDILNFWKNITPKLSLHTLIPILDKLTVFTDSQIIKPIISQPKSDIDFSDIINNRKIFIANLSKGSLGEKNALLLGSFILSGFQLAIMARSNIPKPQRKFFSLIIDEFHNYAGSSNVDSVNSLLSEARKYKLALVTATQFLSQVDRKIKDAIMGNVGTLMCLRVGIDDAGVIQRELGQFDADDILNLKVGEAIVRMGTSKDSFNLQIPYLQNPVNDNKQKILELARQRKTASTHNQAVVPPAGAGSNNTSTPNTPIQNISNFQPTQSQSNLSSEEKDFLTFLYQAPELLPLGQVGKKLGLDNRKVYNLASDLLKKGLTAESKLALASTGRKARTVIITSDGITSLGHPSPTGKGGALHQYFQRTIKSYAEKQGYQVIIEKFLDKQKSVDLHLEKGADKTAVEISVTTNATAEIANIQKCLSAGYDRIIVLCVNNQTLIEVEKRIKQQYDTKTQAKLFSSAVTSFPQVI